MDPVVLSAKGTKLSIRGRATRQQLLEVAVRCLADGGPGAVSANLIAREAGVTWGTVQHQFGDVDTMWAAVLEHVAAMGPLVSERPSAATVEGRVREIVDALWLALDTEPARAIDNLRAALPRTRDELERLMPRTAAAIAAWDASWAASYEGALDGLMVDRDRMEKARSFLPGAVAGLRTEQHLSTYTDVEGARQGLAEAVGLYLSVT